MLSLVTEKKEGKEDKILTELKRIGGEIMEIKKNMENVVYTQFDLSNKIEKIGSRIEKMEKLESNFGGVKGKCDEVSEIYHPYAADVSQIDGIVEDLRQDVLKIGDNVTLLVEHLIQPKENKEDNERDNKEVLPGPLEDQIRSKVTDPSQVVELVLEYCYATEIKGLTEAFVNLRTLTIRNVGLKSLNGLPFLPNLRTLNLRGNDLTGGFDIIARNCPQIDTLNVSLNSIDDVDVLAPLNNTNLCELIIGSNPICKDRLYRNKILSLLGNVTLVLENDYFEPTAKVAGENSFNFELQVL